MASPSASSATLSIHSSQYGKSWDDIDTSSENGSAIDTPADEQLERELGYQMDENESHFEGKVQHILASNDDGFVLPEEYLQINNDNILSALMKAASNPDPRVLKAVLSSAADVYTAANELCYHESGIPLHIRHYDADPTGHSSLRVVDRGPGITTPLMEAIRARLPENIKMLLEAGALPSGIPHNAVSKYSAFFLRFRPLNCNVENRETLLYCMDLDQLAILTMEEVEDRFWEGMAPFWCEEGFTPTEFYPHGNALSSLIEAAKSGSIRIFDQLMAAGADKEFWMKGHASWRQSSLCVSTPLHAAVMARDTAMLEHILDLGFDPNVMPLANPTRCVTPLMATITSCDPFNKEAFDILASHPLINFNIRTPVYRVHLLHFAVARLDLEMVQTLSSLTPLSEAGITALGHNLLHIACMPANSLQIQRHSEIIFRSIHETRDLSSENDAFVNITPWTSSPSSRQFYVSHFPAQTSLVKFLWTNGIQGIHEQDVHGNTPLHYLAGCHVMNRELLNWWLIVLKRREVEVVWREGRNAMGVTPEELCGEAERAWGEWGWKRWFGREWRVERVMRKERIWRWLLNDYEERRKRGLIGGGGRGCGRGGIGCGRGGGRGGDSIM